MSVALGAGDAPYLQRRHFATSRNVGRFQSPAAAQCRALPYELVVVRRSDWHAGWGNHIQRGLLFQRQDAGR